MSHVPQPSQAAYDASPYGILDAALDELATRGARGGDSDRTVMRAFQKGSPLGHFRMRSVVNEGDRFKFYGLRFFLDERDILSARRLVSSFGTLHGVEVETPYGTMRFDAPPGLRTPSGKRSRRQNARPSKVIR